MDDSSSNKTEDQNESDVKSDTKANKIETKDTTDSKSTASTEREVSKPARASFKPSVPRRLPGLGAIKSLLRRLPQVYIVEYVIYLVVSGSLIGIAIYLWDSIFSSIGSDATSSVLTDSFTYSTSIGVLASVLVLLPALLWLQRRNHNLEVTAPEIKNHRWRKGFLAIFLLIISLIALSTTVGIVQAILTALPNLGLNTGDKQPELWKSLVKQGFNAVLLISVAAIYARDYRHNDSTDQANIAGRKQLLNKALALIVTILVIVFLFVPFRKQRNSYVDSVISKDVSTIIGKLQTVNKNNIDSVDDLDVNEHIKKRAGKYNYAIEKSGNSRFSSSYRVCADFKTDTTSRDDYEGGGVYPLSGLLRSPAGGSRSSESGISYSESRRINTDTNPRVHGKGRQCFRAFASSGIEYSDPADESDFNPQIEN